MTRVVILTAMRRGSASQFLPALAAHPGIDVALVIFSEGQVKSRWKHQRRKLRKIGRIGVLGGLTGLHLRTWVPEQQVEELADVTRRLGIPLETTPRFACDRTRELIRGSRADLGLTLGTQIITTSVFEVPPLGMFNVHGDVLPRFRGGSSVMWPIYEGVAEAGFTIHQIDRGIDTGKILYVERFPIEFRRTLRETYLANVLEIQRRVPRALAEVVARQEEFRSKAQIQGEGTTYTTPTFWQFLRMLRQHRRLRREAMLGRQGDKAPQQN